MIYIFWINSILELKTLLSFIEIIITNSECVSRDGNVPYAEYLTGLRHKSC